jgi:O-antigen/teichoic acid export membrane protein
MTAARSPAGNPVADDGPVPGPQEAQTATPHQAPARSFRWTAATNLGLAGLAVATGVLAARLLGPTGEGELAAIQTWPMLLGTLAMLGLDSAVIYFIARQPERGRQITSTATTIGVLSTLTVGAASWFALPYLLSAQRPEIVSAARIFLLIGVIYAVIGIPHGALLGVHSFASWNLFRFVPVLAWLGILLAAWFLGSHSPVPLSMWYLAGVFLCCLPVLPVAARKLHGPAKADFRMAPKLLRFGLPSALTSLPQTVNLRLDQLLIIAFLPARSLGLYVVAVAWSGAVAPLLAAVGSVLFPHVSAEREPMRQTHLLGTALQGGALVAIATSAAFAALAPIGLPLVFGARFSGAVPSALILVPAGAVLAWSGIAEDGLQGLGRPAIVLVAELAGAAVTLAALPLLLHAYGIAGAAVASLLGYSAVAAVAVAAIRRSTGCGIRSLVIPTWPVTKSLAVRSAAILGLTPRAAGRHRPRSTP